jgi:hypothetical protein
LVIYSRPHSTLGYIQQATQHIWLYTAGYTAHLVIYSGLHSTFGYIQQATQHIWLYTAGYTAHLVTYSRLHSTFGCIQQATQHTWLYTAGYTAHLVIYSRLYTGSQYFNYKQYHSTVLQVVVDADLKLVTVDVGVYGKQRDGGVFRNWALYQSLETRSLLVPEDTVLPHSEITLPYIFVGDEVYLLTTYLI